MLLFSSTIWIGQLLLFEIIFSSFATEWWLSVSQQGRSCSTADQLSWAWCCFPPWHHGVQLTRPCPLHYLHDSTQSTPKLCRSSFDFSVTGSGYFPVLAVRTAGCTAHLQVLEIFSHFVNIYPVLLLLRRRVAWQGATMYFTKRRSLHWNIFALTHSLFKSVILFVCVI